MQTPHGPDVDHLVQTIDRAIDQLVDVKDSLLEGKPGAIHALVRAVDAVYYARKQAVKMGSSVLPRVENLF